MKITLEQLRSLIQESMDDESTANELAGELERAHDRLNGLIWFVTIYVKNDQGDLLNKLREVQNLLEEQFSRD